MNRIPIPVWYQPYGTSTKIKVLLFEFCGNGAVVLFESGQFRYVDVADLKADSQAELFDKYKWDDVSDE